MKNIEPPQSIQENLETQDIKPKTKFLKKIALIFLIITQFILAALFIFIAYGLNVRHFCIDNFCDYGEVNTTLLLTKIFLITFTLLLLISSIGLILKKGWSKILSIILLIILIVAVTGFFIAKNWWLRIDDLGGGNQPVKEKPGGNTQTIASKIVTLTSPKNGATYSKSKDIRIAGKTKPGYYIQVYANYPTKDLQCLTFNSFSNGGASQADANGNFDLPIAYEGYRSGQNTLVVAALKEVRGDACFPVANVSDVIMYTYTGSVLNP